LKALRRASGLTQGAFGAKSGKGSGGKIKDSPVEAAMLAAFGSRMRALREAMGWTEEEMAAQIGRSRQSIGAWESGNNFFPAHVAWRVCRVFNVTSDFVYFGRTSGLTGAQRQWLIDKGVISNEF
jgi:DNA-binding XRE family transcriptional regulator